MHAGLYFGYGIEFALLTLVIGLVSARVIRLSAKKEKDTDRKRNLNQDVQTVGAAALIVAVLGVFAWPAFVIFAGIVGGMLILAGFFYGLYFLGCVLFGLMARSDQAKSTK